MLLSKKPKPRRQKSKSKKQRTFTSSQFSLPEDKQKSLSELFRNDLLRRRQCATPAMKKNKSQKQLGTTTKKKGKSRSKLRLDKCQTYQVVGFKNSLNSEIIFSNEDTRRQGVRSESSGQVAIRVNQQFLVDNNQQLRINIRKEYQRKVQAAVKIQKVFRGYLTRRILLKYVQNQHRILSQRLAQNRSEQISQHSSYFNERHNHSRRSNIQHRGVFEDMQQNNEQSSSQQDMQAIMYRHHEPIYSQEDLNNYLESSQDEDFDQDAFDQPIIFQTNEEYLDSRKSSQQPPTKNRLSRGSHQNPDPITQEPPETPTNPPQIGQELTKTQKKQERRVKIQDSEQLQIKDSTLKLNQDSKERPSLNTFMSTMSYQGKQQGMRKSKKRVAEYQACPLQQLKGQEASRWQEMISLVQAQIDRNAINNGQLCAFMQQIMNLSMKNRQLLQEKSSVESEQDIVDEQKSLSRMSSRQKIKSVKAQRNYLIKHQQQKHQHSIQPAKIQKNLKETNQQDKVIFFAEPGSLPQHKQSIINQIDSVQSPKQSLQRSEQLKKFLSGNMQDQQIQEMLKFRQQLMKKRQKQDMRVLNRQLQSKLIDQAQFLLKLDQITQKYVDEKASIQKAREDIAKGHKAALRLTRQAVSDAKKLGYVLPISRSTQGLRNKGPLFSDVLIDELALPRKQKIQSNLAGRSISALEKEPDKRRRMFLQISQDESSDLQFTQEELNRFRRAQPFDIQLAQEIADLGRNVMISQQLLRQQQVQQSQHVTFMQTQHVSRQIFEIEDVSPLKSNPKVQTQVDKVIQWILLQFCGQMLLKPIFSQRLMDRRHVYKPKTITDQQRLHFISLLRKHFPSNDKINQKLNQKICPLPTQLLRCMRIDLSEEQQQKDQDSYQQVGKYDFIIDQDICNMAIKQFKQEIQKNHPLVMAKAQEINRIAQQYPISERLVRYLKQRQTYISNRRTHTQQLRWEVLNIQLHCIFDAWNEELIFLRSQKTGYSGIGLNQLTLSTKDHNTIVPLNETLDVVEQGRKRLIYSLSMSSPSLIFPLVNSEEDQELLESDSRWIFYADQALTYGLQLVYLSQQQIFGQMARQLQKLMLKNR